MLKHYLLLSFIAAALGDINITPVSAQAVNTGYLNINNVNAGFGSSGNFFTTRTANDNADSGYLLYEVPKGTNKRAIFTSALWLSAFDGGGNLHLAGQTYFQDSTDYFPGPIGDTSSSEVRYCHNVFSINRAAVNQFQSLSFPTTWTHIDPSILDWPGYGNPFLDTFLNVQITTSLAPFVDVDHDGIYNPLKGDYPDFCGDQAVFFVYNDSSGARGESGCSLLGFEIRGLAYEVVNPDTNGYLNNAKTAVNNTVFLHLEIENKSGRNYSDFHLGLFEDPDVGCYENDRVGCDTNRNLMFAYNGTTPDPDCANEIGYAPYQAAHGVIMLNQKMRDFIYFANGGIGGQTDPTQASACIYYNYLTGFWADTTPITLGGTGYGGRQPFNFCFPGDPNDTSQWSEVTVPAMQPGDRRMMGSTSDSGFNAGEVKNFDFAFTTTYDSTGPTMLGIVDTLKRDDDSVQAYYNNNLMTCTSQLTAGIKNVSAVENMELRVFPNPASNQITVESGANIQSLELMDMQGRMVIQLDKIPATYTLNVSQFAKGVYLLKAMSGNNYTVKKVVIE